MSKFITQDITAAGLQMLANALAGSSITFTKIVLGSGFTDQQARNVEALVQPVVELEILKLQTTAEPGTAVVGTAFSNVGLSNDFYYRELGVYATSPELGEVLYSYANAGDNAELIPAVDVGGDNLVEKTIDAIVIVGNAENVTAYINTDAFATVQQVEVALTAALAAQTAAAAAQVAAEGAEAEATAADAAVTAAVNQINTNTANIQTLWDAIFNDITGNPFSVTFSDTSGVTIVAGIWNSTNARLEC